MGYSLRQPGPGVTIMARVDHAAGAKKADLDPRHTETLIFGKHLA